MYTHQQVRSVLNELLTVSIESATKEMSLSPSQVTVLTQRGLENIDASVPNDLETMTHLTGLKVGGMFVLRLPELHRSNKKLLHCYFVYTTNIAKISERKMANTLMNSRDRGIYEGEYQMEIERLKRSGFFIERSPKCSVFELVTLVLEM